MSERTGTRLLRLPVALIVVNGVLLAPGWVLFGGLVPPYLSPEAFMLVGLFWLLPRTRRTALAGWLTGALVVLFTLVGFGDTATRLSLSRPLNLYVDFWLLGSVRDLLVGMLGSIGGFALLASIGVAGVLVTFSIGYLLNSVRGARTYRALGLGAGAVLVCATFGFVAERTPPLAPYVDWPVGRLSIDQSRRFTEMLGERERFEEAMATSPGSYADVPELLARLGGRDVVFGFVESYGVSALYDPRYAPVVGPRLDDFEARMDSAGLYLATGTLVAPSQGGQSWFGHGSVLSGLWLDNQVRYDMMLLSDRETLIDDFQRAGYTTAALMPAIIMAWPEGERFGYDEVYTRNRIDYAGPPLNWVEMPDQFTWSFLEHTIRPSIDRPLFTEIALISSHAPWTPILSVFDDWETIGDGEVFDEFDGAGERPEDLWRDYDRVREHYALSIEYAIHAMASYAERYVNEDMLLMVLGDHQPAPLVTGDGVSWEVPVHVISGDPALVAPFLKWGFAEGAWPPEDPDREALGMDFFRDWFVRAYSGS